MKIISRYMLRHFLPVFCLALATFVGLYLIIDFFEKVDNMLEKHISSMNMFSYFLYKVPFIVTQGIPMAVLLGTLISLGLLKRNRELIALETAGIKPSFYAAPIMWAGLLLSIIHFGMGETISRAMNERAQIIWQEEVLQNKTSASYSHENVWYRGQGLIYQIRLYDRQSETMEKVSLFFLDDQFRLTQRMDAKRFRWQGKRWVAEEGLLIRFNGRDTEQEWFSQKEMDLKEKPDDFGNLETIPEKLSWLDLYRYTQKIRQEGYNSTPYEVELNIRGAMPLTTFILALLGIIIALRQGIHGGIAMSVGVALIVALFYLTVLQLGSGLATAGLLPPFLGVWSGNLIFAALTGYLWITDARW